MAKRLLGKAALALFFFSSLAGMAGAQETRPHFITVSNTSSVLVRPNLGILVMSIQSSEPLAADAVAENAKKVKAVQSAIEGLGYPADNFKIAPVVLSGAGVAYYAPGQPSVTTILASQDVYVFFQGNELSEPAELNRKSAAVVDALVKAGAVPSTGPFRSPWQPQGTLMVYTLKDPTNDEARALQQAMAEARAKAQDIARGMHVEISRLGSINSYVRSYPQQLSGQLDDLPYRYYSTESDEVTISMTANLAYEFK